MGALEDRYLAGELDFEAAASEALGTDVARPALLPLLRALHRHSHPGAQISEHDAELYDAAGFGEDPLSVAVARADREARMRSLTSGALTVEAAAQRLGVSASRVRQRTGAGSLWALKVGHKLLLPQIQFTEDGLVPNIDKVLSAMPDGTHPLTVHGLLTEPSADLTIEGAPSSIVQWLAAGGDPEAALDIVAASSWQLI
ncbi:hypothetical protein [Hoyosella subflava]|uniref:DNA-binding protein n=1 Tax=Hoyosella subflava (strain DSM 45089 / JCM 17490 / NBRC 109087 / DQS3-9A1) TaxID=443218 RepID=F6ESG3_HOYSD|nr:hypothetical protein [Hoyosella subflava]AEF43084.1 hypothetical protein AS9A_P20040 [Hoyosella subflava DQS3-9A1]